MIRSLLIGAVGGMRSLTPLAVVSAAARRGRLPEAGGVQALLAQPLFSRAVGALAVGEVLGDKMKSAPDRTAPIGIAARIATSALAGAAVAPRNQRYLAGALGAAGAVVAAYLTFNGRMRAMGRYGQTSTGVIEDAIAFACATWLVRGAERRRLASR